MSLPNGNENDALVLRLHELQIENLKGAISLGIETLKSITLLNGGAAVAVLTFYGNALKDAAHAPVDKLFLRLTLASFAAGTFFSVIAFVMAYLSQLFSGTAAAPGKHEVHVRREIRLRICAVISGLISISAFGGGLVSAIFAFG
jgi:hypothetical protein